MQSMLALAAQHGWRGVHGDASTQPQSSLSVTDGFYEAGWLPSAGGKRAWMNLNQARTSQADRI